MDLQGDYKLVGVVISPVLLVISVIVDLLRPEYNHREHSFSSLGLLFAPYWFLFNFVAFIVVGCLALLYFTELKQKYKKEGRNTVGITSLQLSSIFWMLTGVFPLSYTIRWLYWIHVFWAVSAYILGGFGMLRMGAAMIQDNSEVHLGLFTIVMAVGVWISILVDQSEYLGALMQLISIFLFFSWLEIFAINSFTEKHG